MGEAQVYMRSTRDRLLALAITLIGGPVLAALAVDGAPLELLGVSFDNPLGRIVLVAIGLLLLAGGLHMALHVLRREPDIELTDEGISFYRFPRPRHVAWSDIVRIEQHDVSYGFGTHVPNMRLRTERRAVSVAVKVDRASPEAVFGATLQRWSEVVGSQAP